MNTNESDLIASPKVINIKLPRVSAGLPAFGPGQETVCNLSSCLRLIHSGNSFTLIMYIFNQNDPTPATCRTTYIWWKHVN